MIAIATSALEAFPLRVLIIAGGKSHAAKRVTGQGYGAYTLACNGGRVRRFARYERDDQEPTCTRCRRVLGLEEAATLQPYASRTGPEGDGSSLHKDTESTTEVFQNLDDEQRALKLAFLAELSRRAQRAIASRRRNQLGTLPGDVRCLLEDLARLT